MSALGRKQTLTLMAAMGGKLTFGLFRRRSTQGTGELSLSTVNPDNHSTSKAFSQLRGRCPQKEVVATWPGVVRRTLTSPAIGPITRPAPVLPAGNLARDQMP